MDTHAVDLRRLNKPRQPTSSCCGSIGSLGIQPQDQTPGTHPADVTWRTTMIRKAAYFRSLRHVDCVGKELEDWLAAEQEIDELLARLPA